jgi:hypothetical protein
MTPSWPSGTSRNTAAVTSTYEAREIAPGDVDRKRQIAGGISDLVPHRRCELDPDKRVGHHGEARGHLPPHRGDRRRDLGDSSHVSRRGRGKHETDAQTGAHATDVLDPLPDAETSDIRDRDQGEPGERHAGHEQPLVDQVRRSRAAGEREDPGHVHEQDRDVEQVVRPVAPAAEEPVGFTELLAGPEIDAAFARIAPREHEHSEGFGHEEGQEREPPQRERDPSVHGHRRHVVDVDDGDDLEEDEIPAAERPIDSHWRAWGHATPRCSLAASVRARAMSGC